MRRRSPIEIARSLERKAAGRQRREKSTPQPAIRDQPVRRIVSARANSRNDRILPSRLAMVERADPRAGRLFTPAMHAGYSSEGDQLVLPGFERQVTGPALPLVLYDLGVGKTAQVHGGAPLALRLFIEAVLSVPLALRRTNDPVAMEVRLRDLLARLYPGERRPRPNEYWPRLMAAVQALDSQEARIPWSDPNTGRSGLRRVVSASDIPQGPGALNDTVRLIVDLPPGSGEGPIVSENLPQWGLRKAAHYRALLGLAYRWFDPGVTRVPVRDGKHWLQVQDPSRYPVATDDDLIAMCFPTTTNKQRRYLAYEARRVIADLATADELRIVNGRLIPPMPQKSDVCPNEK